jgi:hypothetical protein
MKYKVTFFYDDGNVYPTAGIQAFIRERFFIDEAFKDYVTPLEVHRVVKKRRKK